MGRLKCFLLSAMALTLIQCATTSTPSYVVSKESVEPGTKVKMRGDDVALYNGRLRKGDQISNLLKEIEATNLSGQVAVISIVPSVDTPVCEEQTHVLGETKKLNPVVKRITISRDLPMAQARFAKEAKLTNIDYLSDYKTAGFGKKSGLLMRGSELLARGVIVTDKTGKVAYYQIVPDVASLPDMDAAFEVANQLAK